MDDILKTLLPVFQTINLEGILGLPIFLFVMLLISYPFWGDDGMARLFAFVWAGLPLALIMIALSSFLTITPIKTITIIYLFGLWCVCLYHKLSTKKQSQDGSV
jgi:hypothetical protein